MGKHPGILEKLKNKKHPPIPTRRIAIPELEDASMQGAPEIIPVADDLSFKEDIATGSFGEADSGYRARAVKAPSKPVAGSLNMSRLHRSNKPSMMSKLRVFKDTILGKRTKESAALDFAMNHKRVTKRQRRRRMLLAYVATGITVAAVLLVVVLVPGGKAASKTDIEKGLQIAAADDITTKGGDVAAPTVQESPSASDEPIVSDDGILEPQGEEAGLPTEGMEPTTEPTVEPTTEPTVEPTVEPTEATTPIPTTDPDPTPPPITIDSVVKDFVVEADKYYTDLGYSSNHYEYTEDDVYTLAQIITSEARGETRNGMIAVGNVVMNRVLNRYKFPNSIKGVVTAPGQFAYNSGLTPTRAAKKAAWLVLHDEVWVIAQDVYYFRSGAPSGADWGGHQFYTKIGGHCFYSHGYGGRHRGGEAPPKLFDRTYKYAQFGCKPEKRVYRIQWMLNKLGYDVKADSYFGKGSVDAIKAFQEKYGMEADGIAGPSTVEKLIDTFGITNYYQKFMTKK